MIEVHLLRYALAAAESGSFSRAADRFRVKQSTLSKRIRHLELRLGLALFERSTRGVAPTPAGLYFLAQAEAIVGDLERLSSQTQALAKGSRGALRLGFQGSLVAGNLYMALEDFRRACPEVELDAQELGSEALLARLDRGAIDLAVMAGPAHAPGRGSVSLWSEQLQVVMARDHPAARCGPLYWTDLRGATFFVTRDDPGRLIAAMIAARLSGADHAPDIAYRAVGRDNLMSFVAGTRVAVIAGGARPAGLDLVYRPVHDAFGPARLDQSLCWRRENASPALARFLALVCTRHGHPVPEAGSQQE